MKLRILALAVSAALSTPAFATPLVDNSCQGISCNTDNSVNQTTTNNNAATGGAATNVNAPVTVNTNTAKIERGAVDVDVHNSNRSYNKNTNIQGQKQGQLQGQFIDDSGNASINWQNQRETASSYAPALIAAQESCVQSQSIGGQTPAFGLSFGITHDNTGCNLRRNAGMLFSMKHEAAAIELLCTDEDVREAMKAAGTPCALDRQTAPQASLQDGAGAARLAAVQPMDPIADDR